MMESSQEICGGALSNLLLKIEINPDQNSKPEHLIEDFTLDKTLDELKERISRLDNPTNNEYQHIRLFFYGGLSIEDASDTTLRELFGEKEIIQIDYESVDAAKIDVFVQDPNQKRYVFESMSKKPVAICETGKVGAMEGQHQVDVPTRYASRWLSVVSEEFFYGYPQYDLRIKEGKTIASKTVTGIIKDYRCVAPERIDQIQIVPVEGGSDQVKLMKNDAILEKNIPGIYRPIRKKDANKYFCPDEPALPKAWKKASEEQKCWEDPKIVSNCAFLSGLAYEESGFREFHPTINVGETQCVLSQSPKDPETLYISIRGTKGKTDILTDLDIDCVSHPDWAPSGNVKVHEGFLKRSLDILDKLETAINHQRVDQGCPIPKKIILTGHSLGGALSSLVHIELVRRESFHGINIGNITFGAPLFGNMAWRSELKKLENSDKRYGQMYHFVNSEDIVPGLLFKDHVFKHLRTSLSMLPRLAQMPGLSGKVKKILKKKTGAETPEESREMDDLFKKLTEHFNGLRDPTFTQPIFDAETSNDLYVPIGNFKYLWNEQLYQLDHNNDPQFVAQALVWSLKIFKDFSSINPFSLNNKQQMKKITECHGIKNYKTIINKVFQNEAT